MTRPAQTWRKWMMVAVAFLAASAMPAMAADARPLTIVVGATPGGTTDTMARVVGRLMGETLGRPVIIDNRAGAGGNLAADFVAKSPPNGDRLLMSFTSHTINASLYKNLPFDPVKDFTPITMVSMVPGVLAARGDAPFNTVAELIDYARAHPGKISAAIGGLGSSLHMATEQFKLMAGVDLLDVPYKSTTPAITDLLGGQADIMFASSVNVAAHAKSGRVKILGVTSPEPLPQFPGVPPIGATVKGFESQAWFGLFAPAGMSPELVKTFYDAARKAIDDPSFLAVLGPESARPAKMTQTEFAAFIQKDIDKWAKVVAASGAKPE